MIKKKRQKLTNLAKYWLQGSKVFSYAQQSPDCFSPFQTDVRFDTEHTVNTKAGNRVSSPEGLQA